MTRPTGDEALRALERAVAAGDPVARVRLAAELERRGRERDAEHVLLEAVRLAPQDRDARLALGRFRGAAPGPWGAVRADARNTRLSPARGPRGEGKVLAREPIAAFDDGFRHAPTPPPLVGAGVAQPLVSLGSRTVLALTADGHVISEAVGQAGFELSAEREGVRAWRFTFENAPDEDDARWSRSAHAAIGPDGSVYAFVRSGKLIAVEPTGEERWRREIPSRVLSLALDAERGRVYLGCEHPPVLLALEEGTGRELFATRMEPSLPPDEAIVCNDGRVACVTPFRSILVVAPDGRLERVIDCDERISGTHGALAPWGELVAVSSDPKGAHVEVFDPATGLKKSNFEVTECYGVPAIDRDGTIYLDGGARGYVLGFDLVSGAERYRLDRPTLWQRPDRPGSSIAVGDGEVLFLDFAPSGVALVRAGGSREASPA